MSVKVFVINIYITMLYSSVLHQRYPWASSVSGSVKTTAKSLQFLFPRTRIRCLNNKLLSVHVMFHLIENKWMCGYNSDPFVRKNIYHLTDMQNFSTRTINLMCSVSCHLRMSEDVILVEPVLTLHNWHLFKAITDVSICYFNWAWCFLTLQIDIRHGWSLSRCKESFLKDGINY